MWITKHKVKIIFYYYSNESDFASLSPLLSTQKCIAEKEVGLCEKKTKLIKKKMETKVNPGTKQKVEALTFVQ